MSLGDAYLREAILRHRSWIREIFWVTNSTEHDAWARVATVHRVTASYSEMWTGIASAIRENDPKGELTALLRDDGDKRVEPRARRAIRTARNFVRDIEANFLKPADALVSQPHYTPRDFVRFVRQCEDLGFEVPAHVVADPRYEQGWTHGPDPGSHVFAHVSRVARGG